MDSQSRLIAIISTLICLFASFAVLQAESCNTSNNDYNKVKAQTDLQTAAYKRDTDIQVAQSIAAAKAACVEHGGSYDERGSCYRGVSAPSGN